MAENPTGRRSEGRREEPQCGVNQKKAKRLKLKFKVSARLHTVCEAFPGPLGNWLYNVPTLYGFMCRFILPPSPVWFNIGWR